MNSSPGGLGQPSPGQPDFDGPAATPQQPGQAPGGAFPQGQPYPQGQLYPQAQPYPQGQSYPQGQPYPQGQSYPPTQSYPSGQTYPQQPPGQWGNQPYPASGGYQPPVQPPPTRPSGSGGRGLILAGVIIVVLILGLLGWQFLVPQASQQPTPGPTPTPSVPARSTGTPSPTVTRVTESGQPTTSTPVSGGEIGQQVALKTRNGAATVTVTKATWADNGMIDPTDGQQYLIVDVDLRGVSGKVTTGPFFASVVDGAGDNHMLTIGADLANPLAMRTLGPGEQNSGQVAFELERGPVTFQVLDELLQPVATVEIPG